VIPTFFIVTQLTASLSSEIQEKLSAPFLIILQQSMTRYTSSLIKQVLTFILTFYIFFSALILIKNGGKYMRFQKTKKHQKRTTTFSQITNATLKFSSNCYKDDANQTYKICTELPFTEIKCGPKYSQRKLDMVKRFQVPDIVFFVWFGDNLKFHFFNYLALRSAAAIHQPERIDFYYSISLPVGK